MEKTYVNTIEYHWIPVFCLAADFFGANCTASTESSLWLFCQGILVCGWVLRRSSENKYICSTTQPQSAWYCPTLTTPLLLSCKPLIICIKPVIFSLTLAPKTAHCAKENFCIAGTPLHWRHSTFSRPEPSFPQPEPGFPTLEHSKTSMTSMTST